MPCAGAFFLAWSRIMSLRAPSTEQVDRFAVCIIQGMTGADALRHAAPQVRKWKDNTIHTYASRWRGLGEVKTRITELEANGREASRLTIEQHVKDLGTLREGAVKVDQYGAAVSATRAQGLVTGLYESGGLDDMAKVPTDDIVRLVARGNAFAEDALKLIFSGDLDGFLKHCAEYGAQLEGVEVVDELSGGTSK